MPSCTFNMDPPGFEPGTIGEPAEWAADTKMAPDQAGCE